MGIKLPRGFRENLFTWRSRSGGRVLDSHDSEGILGDGGGLRNATASTHLVLGASAEDDDVEAEGPLPELSVSCSSCSCTRAFRDSM